MVTQAVSPRYLRLVLVASAVGTVIEWYDFYIFGSLARVLSQQFFSKANPVSAFLETVALFTIGFLIRPLGALIFGRIRKPDRKSTRLNSSHLVISYAVFCLKKKNNTTACFVGK